MVGLWYVVGVRTTIDAAGRVVVPKPIRDRLQISAGETVDIDERDGVIEIRQVGAAVHVVETPEGPVAAAGEGGVALTDNAVRRTLEEVRS